MQGLQVFSSLAEAEASGFTFFMRAADAILVQRVQGRDRALAIVDPAAILRSNRFAEKV
jgi:hypothetical protein